MISELKTYTAHPGKGAQMKRRFEEHSLRLFAKHGIETLGYWMPAGREDQIIYVTRFKDAASRDAAWKGFLADPEWAAVKALSEPDGPLMKEQSSVDLLEFDKR